MRLVWSIILVFGLIAAQWLPSFAQEIIGKVVGVSDGDTLTVLTNQQLIRVRLSGLDAPEKRQAFGQRAKNYTSTLTYNKVVTLKGRGKDRYGRTIADVLLADGRNLNQELVAAGFAWWYRQYAPHDRKLSQLEQEARAGKRGLWLDSHPVPPWEYRHHKPQSAVSTTR